VLLDRDEPVPDQAPRARAAPPEYGYAPAKPTAADGRAMFVGTADDLVDDLRALRHAGVDHVALRFGGGFAPRDVDDFVEQGRRFMELVAPRLYAAGTPADRRDRDPAR
jgi:hypothetical protein